MTRTFTNHRRIMIINLQRPIMMLGNSQRQFIIVQTNLYSWKAIHKGGSQACCCHAPPNASSCGGSRSIKGFLRHGLLLWRPPLIFGKRKRFCAFAGAAVSSLLFKTLLGPKRAVARRAGEARWTAGVLRQRRRKPHAHKRFRYSLVQCRTDLEGSYVMLLCLCVFARA